MLHLRPNSSGHETTADRLERVQGPKEVRVDDSRTMKAALTGELGIVTWFGDRRDSLTHWDEACWKEVQAIGPWYSFNSVLVRGKLLSPIFRVNRIRGVRFPMPY